MEIQMYFSSDIVSSGHDSFHFFIKKLFISFSHITDKKSYKLKLKLLTFLGTSIHTDILQCE